MLLICCALLSARVSVDMTLSYSCKATPIASVLKDISKLSGKTLTADADTSQEILFLTIKDLPLGRLLAKIAYVTSGEWSVSGDLYTLKPASRMRQREEQRELEAKGEKIKSQIQKRLKEMSDVTAAAANEAKKDQTPGDEEVAPTAFDPGEEPALRILEAIDPTILASVTDSRRLVWATNNPTSMQEMLPEGSAELVTQWIGRHNKQVGVSSEAIGTLPDLGDPNLNETISQQMQARLDQMQPIKEPVGKALLVVQKSLMGGLQCELKAFSAKGKLLLSASTDLGQNFSGQEAAKEPGSKSEPTQLPPFQMSPETKQLTELFGSLRTAGFSAGKLPPETVQKLSRLDSLEPLSLLASELVSYYAEVKQQQVVADLPDEFFLGGSDVLGGQFSKIENGEQALSTVTSSKALAIETENGLTTIRSANPAESRVNRLYRKNFSQLINAAIVKGYLSLDDLSGYAVSNRRFDANSIAMIYGFIFFPSSYMGDFGNSAMMSWDAYRFYGSLDADQRNQLLNGGQENYLALNASQASYASDYLFSSEAHYGDSEPTKVADSSPFGSLMELSAMFTGGGNATEEPTELMPDGIARGFISQTARNEPVISFAAGSGPLSLFCLGPSEFGMMKAVTASGMADNSGLVFPKTGRLGERQNLELIFHVAPKIGAHCHLQDLYFAKDSPFVSLDSLPREFTSKADAAAAMMKKITSEAVPPTQRTPR